MCVSIWGDNGSRFYRSNHFSTRDIYLDSHLYPQRQVRKQFWFETLKFSAWPCSTRSLEARLWLWPSHFSSSAGTSSPKLLSQGSFGTLPTSPRSLHASRHLVAHMTPRSQGQNISVEDRIGNIGFWSRSFKFAKLRQRKTRSRGVSSLLSMCISFSVGGAEITQGSTHLNRISNPQREVRP